MTPTLKSIYHDTHVNKIFSSSMDEHNKHKAIMTFTLKGSLLFLCLFYLSSCSSAYKNVELVETVNLRFVQRNEGSSIIGFDVHNPLPYRLLVSKPVAGLGGFQANLFAFKSTNNGFELRYKFGTKKSVSAGQDVRSFVSIAPGDSVRFEYDISNGYEIVSGCYKAEYHFVAEVSEVLKVYKIFDFFVCFDN